MNKLEFDYILQNGESYLVEFKERVNSSLVREMIAFANAFEGFWKKGCAQKSIYRLVAA